jgi:hypothetical protein
MLADCMRSVANIRKELSYVQSAIGSMPAVTVPKELEVEKALMERWIELQPLVETHLISQELINKALKRVINHRVPSAEKEQFRDAMLWEFALAIADTREVHFVTEDKDFSIGDKLRPELAEEAAQVKGALLYYPDAGQLLRVLVPEAPSISVDAVIDKVRRELGQLLADRGTLAMFDIGDLAHGSAHPYLTAEINALAIDFKVALSASRRDDGVAGEIAVRGECMMDVDSGYVFDVRPEDIVFVTPTGTTQLATFLYAKGYSSTPRPVPFHLRRPIAEFIGGQ